MLGAMDTNPALDHDDDDHDRGLQFDLSAARRPAPPARPLRRRRRRRRPHRLRAGRARRAAGSSRLGHDGHDRRHRVVGHADRDAGGDRRAVPRRRIQRRQRARAQSGIVRSDIRSSFGSSTTTAPGVPLTITLKVVDQTGAAQAGHAVYLWHCDRDGKYSLYTVPNENYLRGVQETAADGTVTFTIDLPGLLRRPLAAHPLRGVPEPGAATSARTRWHVADRPAAGRLRRSCTRRAGYEQSVRTSPRRQPDHRQGVQRQLADRAGTVDAATRRTATTARSPTSSERAQPSDGDDVVGLEAPPALAHGELDALAGGDRRRRCWSGGRTRRCPSPPVMNP